MKNSCKKNIVAFSKFTRKLVRGSGKKTGSYVTELEKKLFMMLKENDF